MPTSSIKIYWCIILLITSSGLLILSVGVSAETVGSNATVNSSVTLEEVKSIHAYVRGIPMPPRSCINRTLMLQDIFDEMQVENAVYTVAQVFEFNGEFTVNLHAFNVVTIQGRGYVVDAENVDYVFPYRTGLALYNIEGAAEGIFSAYYNESSKKYYWAYADSTPIHPLQEIANPFA